MSRKPSSYHLFVFVHGFQASSVDMSHFKKALMRLVPEAVCLLSRANEGKTDLNIEQLGFNLATEVKQYITCYMQLKRK